MNLLQFKSPADRSVYINPAHVVSVRRFKGNVSSACSNGADHEVLGDVDDIGRLVGVAIAADGPGIVDTNTFVLPEGVSEADMKAALELLKKDEPATEQSAGQQSSNEGNQTHGRSRGGRR